MTKAKRVAVVTGAGSGVGRAVVLHFAREGWRVVLLGRRAEALERTIALAAPETRECLWALPCDLTEAAAVESVGREVGERFGAPDVLVNAAGTNTPRRSWSELAPADYERLIATNLHAAFYCVRAFLPGMRARRSGTVININSEAGRQASAKSGVAYSAAKFGLTGLTQSLNAEERANGVRACSIFPGDIDTPLLDLRPEPPTPEARQRMLQPEDIAACVWLVATLPPRAIVEEIVVRPA